RGSSTGRTWLGPCTVWCRAPAVPPSAACAGLLAVLRGQAPHTDGVGAVAVPVTHVDLITRTTEHHDDVRLTTGQGVLHVVLPTVAHHREGVGAVAVPVTSQRVVTHPPVGEHLVRRTTGQVVLHVERRPTAHRQRVSPVPVPVTDEHL